MISFIKNTATAKLLPMDAENVKTKLPSLLMHDLDSKMCLDVWITDLHNDALQSIGSNLYDEYLSTFSLICDEFDEAVPETIKKCTLDSSKLRA